MRGQISTSESVFKAINKYREKRSKAAGRKVTWNELLHDLVTAASDAQVAKISCTELRTENKILKAKIRELRIK